VTARPPPRRGQPPRRDLRGRSTDGPMRVGEALGQVASKLGAGRAEVVGTLFARWTDIVGPSVAAHVRPVRVDGETLVVEADHPAWATQVRHVATDILDRVRDACGEGGAPRRIEVRVRA
jgi:predicted nucleic acid-binding Zn ribbon protein